MDTSIHGLEKIAASIRYQLIEMSHHAKTAHVGSSLSCIDLLTVLYWHTLNLDPSKPKAENRDRFILSKGHAALAQYIALSKRGFFSNELLQTYAKPGLTIFEHPTLGALPGIEATSGSLGHGLSIGLGLSQAAKIKGLSYSTYVLMSDGECNEGSVWEAALLAPSLGLENLTVIVDLNGWQATGRSADVMRINPLKEKFISFGWEAIDVDGHNISDLVAALKRTPKAQSGAPLAVIAKTIKGKGVSFMEDDNNWHYLVPSQEHVAKAKQELGIK